MPVSKIALLLKPVLVIIEMLRFVSVLLEFPCNGFKNGVFDKSVFRKYQRLFKKNSEN